MNSLEFSILIFAVWMFGAGCFFIAERFFMWIGNNIEREAQAVRESFFERERILTSEDLSK